mmetsp:Transcript_21552/g.46876  ORF Transcript_21552/g.46876 Transcript_21552/m.46876 type:complete len:254 (+) Transcript_21552:166-927(+)|eukprot:CAMPEP_0172304570 /NCGR_PEP_ID=MMETSP1058-20130122/5970_1 /TAXON_ID=83371 /ORGANISM="Detonula confervacea, Strain CCMP 353" /LENGTH=253 /DNA_ID=CAMNT_0013015857 /DNA_START=107 /DNA_END=868 /DNA_ORIENTATION=+
MASSNALRHAAIMTAVIALALSQSLVLGFSCLPKFNSNPTKIESHATSFNTQLQGSVSKWNEEYESPDEDEGLRDVLSEPAKRKKKGSKEFKQYDNGDALPFVVRVKTPDPYTTSGEMLKQAKNNSEVAKKNNANGTSRKTGTRRSSNLVGTHSTYANSIAASIYSRKKDGSLYKVLGKFELERSTTCGDLLQVGEREFEVVTARAQFKYAGGGFDMVRKILEVKEITRIAEEATLARLMNKESESASGKNFE